MCGRSAAAALVCLDRSTLLDVDAAGRLLSGRLRTHAALDLRGHREERLLHVGGRLGRRLQERNAQLVGVLLCRRRHRTVKEDSISGAGL